MTAKAETALRLAGASLLA
jgi:hypothetical protein